MARRKGRDAASKTGKTKHPDYYEGLPSDARYKRIAHHRVVHGSIRKWVIRLAVLCAIALAVRLWGADVMSLLRVQAHETSEEFEQVGDHIKSGRDTRSGANADWLQDQ